MARDSDLVLRVQRGDAEAFADLARGIGPRLLGVAYSILRDRPLAEDASRQALVRIWRKVPRLRDPSRFDAWSYQIVVRGMLRTGEAPTALVLGRRPTGGP